MQEQKICGGADTGSRRRLQRWHAYRCLGWRVPKLIGSERSRSASGSALGFALYLAVPKSGGSILVGPLGLVIDAGGSLTTGGSTWRGGGFLCDGGSILKLIRSASAALMVNVATMKIRSHLMSAFP